MGRKPEGKAEKMFKDIGKKIDELIQDLDKAKERAKVEYADEIEELKRNGETLKSGFNKFKENNKERWEDIEASLEKAGNELRNAFDAAFSKKSKTEKQA
ncbi:hypothetical protein C900_02259 [Fulvivirga imtechensis AK7]|uniref:Uncharacterized protein n=1 Tax=Fulvivirga imtechensis AK7 TaxID=1237149 RepID=L8JW91_9BACT|nr:hypothetical protein [Fulvivirga imtechensis]ELR71884.1 hypothetical protein C900_02259 [Fulvivirga imtechensis AK7]